MCNTFVRKDTRVGGEDMSSMTGEWCCTECGSHNAYQETFSDDEVGHIKGCQDCGYYDVYRENAETGQVIEEYQGHEHYYAKEDKEKDDE